MVSVFVGGSTFDDRGRPLSSAAHGLQIYTRLQHNEIRTLLLAPATVSADAGSETEQLVCELVAHPHIHTSSQARGDRTVHQYEALSYIWGPSPATKSILCNGITRQITPSLWDALYHLRYKDSWRRLWVDQLCINQRDDEEGGEVMSQVGNMGTIYSGACRVVVWLGVTKSPENLNMLQSRVDILDLQTAWAVVTKTTTSPGLVRSDFLVQSPSINRTVQDDTITTSLARSIKSKMSSFMKRQTRSTKALRESSKTGVPARERSNKSDRHAMVTPRHSRSDKQSPSDSFTNLSRQSTLDTRSSTSTLSTSTRSLRSSRTLSSSTESLYRISKFNKKTSVRNARAQHAPSTPPVHREHKILENALAIFQHPYFTRKWTFQEIVLARAAIFCFPSIPRVNQSSANDEVNLDEGNSLAFSDLASWYFHHVSKLRKHTLLYDSLGSFENVLELRSILQSEGSSRDFNEVLRVDPDRKSKSLRLSYLLMLTRNRGSLKAEDAVYALLGMHPTFTVYLRRITSEAGWLPMPELFLTAFRFCLESEADLNVLSAAGSYKGNRNCDTEIGASGTAESGNRIRHDGWPSWLPDWTESMPLRPLIMASSTATLKSESKYVKSDTYLSGGHHSDVMEGVNYQEAYHMNHASGDEDSVDQHKSYKAAGRTRPIYTIHGGLDDVAGDYPHSDMDDGEHDDRFKFCVRGFRVGVIVPRANKWPNNYFVADTRTQAILDGKAESTFSVASANSIPISELVILQTPRSIDSVESSKWDANMDDFTPVTQHVQREEKGKYKDIHDVYAETILDLACARSEICEPMRCAAAVRAGDWVVCLYGGAMLYVLRPLPVLSSTSPTARFSAAAAGSDGGDGGVNSGSDSDSNSNSNSDNDAIDTRTSHIHTNRHETQSSRKRQCRFIGECAITNLMDGCLVSSRRQSSQHMPNQTSPASPYPHHITMNDGNNDNDMEFELF